MEDYPPSESETPSSGELACSVLAEQRERVHEFVAEHGRRLSQVESDLALYVGHVGDDLSRQQAELVHQQAELRQAQQEFEAAQHKLRRDEQELLHRQREHQVEVEELARLRRRVEERLDELERGREASDSERAETRRQRRRIAEELKSQRQAQLEELGRRRAQLNEQQRRLEGGEKQAAELNALRGRNAELERLLAERPDRADSAAQSRLADLERRYEMALDDLRELKKRNGELEQRLATSAPAAPPAQEHGLDWESQKRRMLAALEAGGDEKQQDPEERLRIRDCIRQTDAVLAHKDKEIAELKRLLESQSSSLGSVAVGAAALEAVLSQDELVQMERQRLLQLQTEWETKLRQAEIELSVERAKNARERAELDERQRLWREETAKHGQDQAGDLGGKPKKSSGGRWLTRLGLKESEEP